MGPIYIQNSLVPSACSRVRETESPEVSSGPFLGLKSARKRIRETESPEVSSGPFLGLKSATKRVRETESPEERSEENAAWEKLKSKDFWICLQGLTLFDSQVGVT